MARSTEEQTKSAALTATLASGRPRLHAFWSAGHVSVELVENRTVTVGRALECDLRIDDASVSRQHVRIHWDGSAQVEDLGGSNGTRVSGQRLRPNETVRFHATDVVEIGAALLVLRPGVGDAATTADTQRPAPNLGNDAARLLTLVAKSAIDVILLGETGVGKEVAAESIHRGSARAGGPLVRLNCSALPDALLEGELFGYEKGAFTGATQSKRGLLEAANGGTVFLDEVGELPLATQAKLLRVFEQREVMRLGSLKPTALDIRVVSATNRDLASAIAAGRFREDLYHRLNGLTITIPPLRERVSEIVPLATRFITDACAAAGRPTLTLTDAARRTLETYAWPGNIRELRKAMERALLFCAGEVAIDVQHLLLDGKVGLAGSGSTRPPVDPARALLELEEQKRLVERSRVLDALERCNGNQTKAAQLLGVSRRTLVNWLESYDLPRPRKRK